jgi:hypothetical protein
MLWTCQNRREKPEADIWQNQNHPATRGSKSQSWTSLPSDWHLYLRALNVHQASRPPERFGQEEREMVT